MTSLFGALCAAGENIVIVCHHAFFSPPLPSLIDYNVANRQSCVRVREVRFRKIWESCKSSQELKAFFPLNDIDGVRCLSLGANYQMESSDF